MLEEGKARLLSLVSVLKHCGDPALENERAELQGPGLNRTSCLGGVGGVLMWFGSLEPDLPVYLVLLGNVRCWQAAGSISLPPPPPMLCGRLQTDDLDFTLR